MRKPNKATPPPLGGGGFQPTLFGYIKPTSKVPISAERLKEAKALLAAGKPKESAAIIREVRYALEAFEKRITAKP